MSSTSKPLSPERQQIEDALDQSTYFDWKDDSIRLICTTRPPGHNPAYGMSFTDYKKNRASMQSSEDVEKVRLSFCFPTFITNVSADMAIRNNLSHYRFLVLIIEMGLIHFQRDYHDQYTKVRETREGLFDSLQTDENERIYKQIQKHVIVFPDMPKGKHITPTVPEWLGNAVKEISVYLNMTTTDFVYLCWCLGVSNSMKGSNLPKQITKLIDRSIETFNFEFVAYQKQIDFNYNQMEI
jgi:hypothetical protein